MVFCALLLTLTSSPAWGICRPENRVGGSPVFSSEFASQESAKPIGTPSENGGYGYDFASGVHKYLYCQGNPVNMVDPSGQQGDIGSMMMSMSISASLDNTYNGVVLTTGNAVQNQIMYGGNAGIYTILLDAGFMVGGQVLMKVVDGGSIAVSKIASGFAVKQELSQFAHAAEYGVLEVRALKKIRTVQQAANKWPKDDVQIHHLIEKRFVKSGALTGVAEDEIPGVVLTKAEHDVFTERWYREIGRNGWKNSSIVTKNAKPDDIWRAAQQVYNDNPVLLEYCRKFLRK